MTIDLSPILDVVLSLCAIGLSTFGSWAIGRLAQRLHIQANNEAIQAFDAALVKSAHAGAGAVQHLIAARGYDHPSVKSTIIAVAAPYALAKFAPALRAIGLDPNNPDATSAYLTAELNRIFPTAMTAFAASPTTPPAPLPVFPAGSMTTEELNTASAAAGS